MFFLYFSPTYFKENEVLDFPYGFSIFSNFLQDAKRDFLHMGTVWMQTNYSIGGASQQNPSKIGVHQDFPMVKNIHYIFFVVGYIS